MKKLLVLLIVAILTSCISGKEQEQHENDIKKSQILLKELDKLEARADSLQLAYDTQDRLEDAQEESDSLEIDSDTGYFSEDTTTYKAEEKYYLSNNIFTQLIDARNSVNLKKEELKKIKERLDNY